MGYTDVSGYIWYVTLDKIVPVYTESTPVQLQLFD